MVVEAKPRNQIRIQEIILGILLNESNISTTPESNNTGNIVLKGNGGVGYQVLGGVDILNSSIKTDKDIVIEGKAGTGEKVELSNGVVMQHFPEMFDGI